MRAEATKKKTKTTTKTTTTKATLQATKKRLKQTKQSELLRPTAWISCESLPWAYEP